MTKMTPPQIIDRWPSLADFAADAGVSFNTAKMMRYRASIHARHWPKIVAAAAKRGIKAVTYEALAKAHAA